MAPNPNRLPVSEELFQELLECTATSTKSFRTICGELNVAVSSMWLYLHNDESRVEQYARTKEMQSDLVAEEMFDISDDRANDYLTDKQGNIIENREWTSRSKLRIDTRKWVLAHLRPKKYGDRQEVRHADADGGVIQVISHIPRPPERPAVTNTAPDKPEDSSNGTRRD